MPMLLFEGDILELKKIHPCGSKNWQVLRTGCDLKIKCLGCGHTLIISRVKLEKAIKKVINNQT